MPDEVLDTLNRLADTELWGKSYSLLAWGKLVKERCILKNCDADLNGYEFEVGKVKDFICDEDDDSVNYRKYPEVSQSYFDVRYPPYNPNDDYKDFDTYEEVEDIIEELYKEGRPYELDTNRGWGVIVLK